MESKPEAPKTANGNWEILECEGSPFARYENSFVEVNDKFYLLGGRGIKPVDIFDPASKSWTSGAEPPIEVHHFQERFVGRIMDLSLEYGNVIYNMGNENQLDLKD